MKLISNTNKPNDRMYKLISEEGKNTQIYIASAFFSEDDLALKMVQNNCTIMLIVRLDYGTSAEALEKIYENPNIDIRFFTGNSFHPKFYIFGNRVAFLGSSNFTHKGLTTNNEINVKFDSEEPVFDELKSVFWDYWEEAEVLTKDKLEKFKKIINDCKNPEPFRSIMSSIGKFEFNNVGREKEKGNSKEKYVSNFRKAYQLYISRFNQLKTIYEETKVRRYPEVPLRIEVDRFLWWIREEYAKGESYNGVPEKTIDEIRSSLHNYIKEFETIENKYLDSSASTRFNIVSQGFANKQKIEKMDFEELFEVLDNIYAFHDTLRFYPGGHETLKESFKNNNTVNSIRKTLTYLLFSQGEYEDRIFNCVSNSEYKLDGFGEHCVKELYGLVNPNDIPICNGRTLKSMEWLGFGKL